jgi:hypothetical protein
MVALLTSAVAVAGTLLGAVVSYGLQRRVAERSERFSRAERLHQERLTAYSEFASAVMELRRVEFARTLAEERAAPDVPAWVDESYQRLAAARSAMFRVQLLGNDTELSQVAEEVVRITSEIHHYGSDEDARGQMSWHTLEQFIELASSRIHADLAVALRSPAPRPARSR